MLPLYHALFFLFSAFFGRKLGHFRFSDSYPLAHRAVSFFLFIPLLHFLHAAAVPLLKQTRHRLVVFAAVFRQKFHDPRLGMLQVAADPVEPDFIQILVDRWNQFTINEDLGNLAEVMTAMANDINSGRVFTAYRTEITEGSENQGAVKFIDEDYEVSYSYQIIPGADPMVTLTRYDSEYDYEQMYTNYQLREML